MNDFCAKRVLEMEEHAVKGMVDFTVGHKVEFLKLYKNGCFKITGYIQSIYRVQEDAIKARFTLAFGWWLLAWGYFLIFSFSHFLIYSFSHLVIFSNFMQIYPHFRGFCKSILKIGNSFFIFVEKKVKKNEGILKIEN